MALIFIEGFDLYGSSTELSPGKWDAMNGSFSFTTGRLGINKCTTSASSTAYLEKTVNNIGTSYFGFAFKLIGSPSSGNILVGYEGGVANFYVAINASRYIELKDAAGTIQDTGTTSLSVGVWYYIEVKAVISNTGDLELKLDGTVEASASGIDIQNSSNSYITAYRLYGNNGNWGFDDHYFLSSSGSLNNTYLGDCRVDPFKPTSDSSVAWTPSTGVSNYAMVDDPGTPDGDSTYVYSATSGAIDLYDIENMPVGTGDVYGLQVVANARKVDAGSKSIKLKVKNGVVATQDSSALALSTNYVNKIAMFETSDGINTLWTKTTVDGAQIGIEVV